MKTATVRDLRNHFADVAKWIDGGEAVTITRNGISFATLAPIERTTPARADWTARFRKRAPVGRGLPKDVTEKIWSDLRD